MENFFIIGAVILVILYFLGRNTQKKELELLETVRREAISYPHSFLNLIHYPFGELTISRWKEFDEKAAKSMILGTLIDCLLSQGFIKENLTKDPVIMNALLNATDDIYRNYRRLW